MPIGAVIGGAVIGAGGAVASGAMGASATRHAANTAADTSLQVANENNALAREIRGQNLSIATPFYNNGLVAGNALQDLLLGGGSQSGGSQSGVPQTQPSSGALAGYAVPPSGYSGPSLDQIMGMSRSAGQPAIDAYLSYYQSHPQEDPGFGDVSRFHGDPFVDENSANSVLAARNGYLSSHPATSTPAIPPPTSGSGGSALDAFDRFRQGTNYQWRYNQGLNAVGSQYAARGALDSGAAEKAKITFGQNIASGELSNYMNLLANQQQVGLSAGNAVMGVNTSFGNTVAANNTNAGNTAANAALVSGQANANMWGTVGNTAGQLGGALFQYGLGQMQQPQVPTPQAINVTPNGTANYFARNGGF
jgi:hypothetical protein